MTGPTVRADADKLRQVFSNIIDNAIDAMTTNQGERRLELSIESTRSNNETQTRLAVVKIRDNGCGIAEDQIKKIFNPFYTSKANGTGLGLGVAKKVIDAHRGAIQVLSQPNSGSEFAISIPLSDSVRDSFQGADNGLAVVDGLPQVATDPNSAAGSAPAANGAETHH